jgi:hypothetical protein
MAKPYLSLAPSEQAVTQAAAEIYAAYIVAGRVPAGEEAKWREQAIREAIEIAKAVDASVHAAGEMA